MPPQSQGSPDARSLCRKARVRELEREQTTVEEQVRFNKERLAKAVAKWGQGLAWAVDVPLGLAAGHRAGKRLLNERTCSSGELAT